MKKPLCIYNLGPVAGSLEQQKSQEHFVGYLPCGFGRWALCLLLLLGCGSNQTPGAADSESSEDDADTAHEKDTGKNEDTGKAATDDEPKATDADSEPVDSESDSVEPDSEEPQSDNPDSEEPDSDQPDSEATDTQHSDSEPADSEEPDSEAVHACPPLDTYEPYFQATLSNINANGSGITWNPETQTFFVVANLERKMWEYGPDFGAPLREITLSNMDFDTEGIEYLGQNRYAITTESNVMYVVEITDATTRIDGNDDTTSQYVVSDPPPVNNAGIEGNGFLPSGHGAVGTMFVCQEYKPMRVLSFELDETAPPYGIHSAPDGTLDVKESFDAQSVFVGEVTDLAGMTGDPASGNLLILSQESSVLLRVDAQNGDILERLEITSQPYFEGVTWFGDCQLALLSEPNFVQFFRPKD